MPWSKVLNFTDPFQYAAAVRNADMQLFPTTGGEFRAEITQVVLNKLWMQRFSESLPRVHLGAIRPGRRVFTFLTEDQREVYNRGRLITFGEICADDFELQHVRTSRGFHLGSASLEPDALATAGEAIVGREIDTGPCDRFVRPPPDLTNRLLQVHETIGAIAKTTPELFKLPSVVRVLEQNLVHALIRCVSDGSGAMMRRTNLRNSVIIARLEVFLDANPHTPLHLMDVCTAIGARERALRFACVEYLGMGPIRYLTLRRMYLTHHALVRADPTKKNVTDIATEYGFWELGRFSVAYRALFGEMPSQTLRRPPDYRLLRLNRPSTLQRLN